MGGSSPLQWLSLVAVVWLQCINGTNTVFPAYSSQLKNLLSISQVQLNNLAFASDAGKLFGWVSGLATLYLPLWAVLMIGATLGLISYGVQFLFLAHKITSLTYCQIFVLTIFAGNSICWINTVCYAIVSKNFPWNGQIAVGLSTSYVGLSAKVYTSIVDVVSPPSLVERAKMYLLLNSVLPLLVSIVAAPLVRDVEVKQARGLEVGFIIMFVITMMTGLYAVISTLGLLHMFTPSVHAIILGVLLATPLVIPLKSNKLNELNEKKWVKKRVHHVTISALVVDVEKGENAEVKETEEGVEDINETKVIEEIGVKLMLKRIEFWLYFFVYMFGATLGLVFLNNLGQIAESRSHPNTSSLVSLSSSFCFFGRIVPSLLDYYFAKKKCVVSKTASIAVLMTPMAGAFFLLLHSHNISLYLSTAIIGVCTGAISSIAVSTTTELFGIKNFNVNHNIVVANIPIGSFLFGYFAGVLYQREGNNEGSCIGEDCYRETFFIWGIICSFGTLLSFILYVRTRKHFQT